MRVGKPAIDSNGRPMEIHHTDGTHEGPRKPMTREEHRMGTNYLLNHPWLRKEDMNGEIQSEDEFPEEEIYVSSILSDKNLGAFFRYYEDAAYLYFCNMSMERFIIGRLHIMSVDVPDFSEKDVRIEWNSQYDIIGLFIRNVLWGAFNLKGEKFGGDYGPEKIPAIPSDILASFHNQ